MKYQTNVILQGHLRYGDLQVEADSPEEALKLIQANSGDFVKVDYEIEDVDISDITLNNIELVVGNGTTTDLSFGEAIDVLKEGLEVARKGWNGRGIFIKLQTPDENSKMTHPYTYIDTTELQTDNPDAPKDRVPWFASQTDMLAEDWMIVE